MTEKEYKKLWNVSRKLEPYYTIDKVKPWSVYVCELDWYSTRGIDGNIFDIFKNSITCYGDFTEEEIIPKALPIIKEIQRYLEVYKL